MMEFLQKYSLPWTPQQTWVHVTNLFSSEENLVVWGTFTVILTSYWSVGCLYLILDVTGRPKCLQKYKIQQDQNIPINKQKLRHSMLWVAFDTVVLGFSFINLIYPVMVWRGSSFGKDLPSLPIVILHFSVFLVTEEALFYYSHRLLHHPMLYKHIHKKHHEWTSPIGIVADYAHPIEYIISNTIPMWTGPLLMGSHLFVMWIWFILALVNTCISHSGYHLPFLPSPQAHDYHHLKFNNNYGSSGVLDWLHGTDDHFQTSIQHKRHFVSWSLTPVHEIVPKESNAKTE